MAVDMNVMSVTGRLTRDAQLKSVKSYSICEFDIAVNGFKKEDTFYIKVQLWGKTAESMHQWLLKGKQVAVSGAFKFNKWTNKEGEEHSQPAINATSVCLIGGVAKNEPSVYDEDDSGEERARKDDEAEMDKVTF